MFIYYVRQVEGGGSAYSYFYLQGEGGSRAKFNFLFLLGGWVRILPSSAELFMQKLSNIFPAFL